MTARTERRLPLGLAIAVDFVFGVLLGTTSGSAMRANEGFYSLPLQIRAWFTLLSNDRGAALQRQQVDLAWTVNHEHPGLIKSLFALSHWKLQAGSKCSPRQERASVFRLMCFGALAVSVTTLWAMRRAG